MNVHYPLDIWYDRNSRALQLDQQALKKARQRYDSAPKFHYELLLPQTFFQINKN